MQRFIKSYANDAAIQAAVDNKELGKPYVALNEQTGEIDWNGKISYAGEYLTIEALEDGVLKFSNNCNYSVNGGEWEVAAGSQSYSISVPVAIGDKIRVKRRGSDGRYLFQKTTLSFNVYGNLMSLIAGDDFEEGNISYFELNGLFKNCNKLIDASNLVLPDIVFDNCYDQMFYGCSSLVSPPRLPATTLASGCYGQMFNGCSSLTTAPELPATTLETGSYNSMFYDCRSLNYIKSNAENPGIGNVYYWTYNVSPTGTFVKKAGVTWPTGNSGIPLGWTVIEE